MTALPETGTVRIPLDRGALDRWRVPPIVITALALAVIVVAVTWTALAAGPIAVMFVPVLFLEAYVLLEITSDWLRTRRIDVPVELSPDGVVLRSAHGEARAPWSAVTAVGSRRAVFGRTVSFALTPGHATGRLERHSRKGIHYAIRILDVEPDVFWAEVSRASGGRF